MVIFVAEETSTYSWLRFCTVNCRLLVSNYQLSHKVSGVWSGTCCALTQEFDIILVGRLLMKILVKLSQVFFSRVDTSLLRLLNSGHCRGSSYITLSKILRIHSMSFAINFGLPLLKIKN